MDPNAYLNPNAQGWATQLLSNTTQPLHTSSTPQSSYPQQQRVSNFAGSMPTGSTPTQYHQPPSNSPQPSSATSSTTPSSSSYYNFTSNGTTLANANGSSNGSANSLFYNPFYYTSGSLPISQYSSLSGATNAGPNPSLSTPTPSPTPQQSMSMLQQQSSQQSNQMTQALQLQQLQQMQQFKQQMQMQSQQHQQQPQQQPPQQQQSLQPASQQAGQTTPQLTAIDPALVGGNPYSVYRSQYPPNTTLQSSNGQGYQMPPNYQFLQSPPVISPALLTRSPHGYSNALANRPSTQATSAAPPSSSNPSSVTAAAPSTAGASTSSTQDNGLPPVYKDILTPRTLDKSPETTANSIISLLTKSNWTEIDCATRLDILTKIRDNAGKDFYKVWARNIGAMEVLKDWLKSTVTQKGWEETLMPLLFIIDRLPVGVDELTSTKIGKVIVKIVNDPPSGAVKDLASNIEAKWRKIAVDAAEAKKKDEERNKKRKIEPPAPKTAPPAKKAATSTGGKPTATVVKKVIPGATKDSKADSSFFSSKPKPKLPSFRRNPAAPSGVKKEDSPAETAQPSSIDPFQEAMKLMGRSVGSPSLAASEAAAAAIANTLREATPSTLSVALGKNGKPKKRVQFPTEEKMVQIKYIERAVYDGDDGEGAHHSSYRDLDIDEGHALHALLFEEQVDWYEPPLIEFPPETLENLPRGTESTEIAAQEEREKSALMAVYMSDAHIPDTPSDLHPGMDAPPDESKIVMMSAGAEVANLEAPPPPTASLHDLLAKIAGTNPDSVNLYDMNGSGYGDGATYPDFGQAQEGEMSWGAGNSAGPNDMFAQGSANAPNWNGQGLPPPTGSGFSDDWEPEVPTGPRRQQRPWSQSNYTAGIRYNAPCKFFNGRAGCRNGAACPFIHGNAQ